jgi:hypothetical protein
MRDWENNIRRVVPYTPGEQPKNTFIHNTFIIAKSSADLLYLLYRQ